MYGGKQEPVDQLRPYCWNMGSLFQIIKMVSDELTSIVTNSPKDIFI